MTGDTIYILIVEDNPADERLVVEMLRECSAPSFKLSHADRLALALSMLEKKGFDLVLLDLDLPDSKGLAGLQRVRAQEPQIPVILLTGINDESIGLQALREGAGDYLVKGQINQQHLSRSVRYAIERKQTEEEIRRSRLWLERIAGTTPDIIFVLDIVNHRNVYTNKSVIDLLGYAPEEFGGIDDILEKVIEPEDRARVAEFYRQMADARHGEVRVLTIPALHKDGRTLWLETRATPFSSDENGTIVEIIAISHDVTDLMKAQEVLRRDRETFERLVDERTAELVEIHHELDKARHLSDIGMLASTVAHELRNPLGVIKTAVYNINRKKQGNALDKHLATINKKIDESNQIITNLLMYARIKQPTYETVRVEDLLRESVESVKARSDGRPVTFRGELRAVASVMATLDPIQIAGVVGNILTNAVQAIPAEGSGTVTLSARAVDGMLHILVSDTGAGIDPEILPHVFEPFYTSKSKGTGLGLSLCRELVSLHNGSINIESELGKGTTVTVVLPLSPGPRPVTA